MVYQKKFWGDVHQCVYDENIDFGFMKKKNFSTVIYILDFIFIFLIFFNFGQLSLGAQLW